MAGDTPPAVAAHVAHLCEHCICIRVGASGPFPAPYRYSVFAVHSGEFAEIVGFDHPRPAYSEYKAVIQLLNQATGKLVAYDRAGPPPTRHIQLDPGLTKGKLVMAIDRSHLSKTHIPSPARAQKRDGSINMDILEKDGAKMFKLFKGKKEKMLNVERITFSDGSVMDCFHHIAADAATLKG